MKYFSILFLLLTVPIQALHCQNSQDCDCYDRLINLSDYYEKKGDLIKAIETFEKGMGFKGNNQWNPYEYFRLGQLYAISGNVTKSSKYLEEALVRGFNAQYLDYDEFDDIKKSQSWKILITRLDSLKREYHKNINLEYRLAVEDIRGSYQTIRKLIKVPDSTFHKLDSINYIRMKKLVEFYGYPNMNSHGFDGSQGVYLLLLHASMYSEKIYQETLIILEKAIQEFSYKKSNLAQFKDRRKVWYHKEDQIYGTWNAYGTNEFNKISELFEIDKRRFTHNLLRLKEQAIIENRILPKFYEPILYPKNFFCGYEFME